MKVQRIDMEAYGRKTHFDYFRQMGYPYVGLTANADVTGLVGCAKEKGESVFLYLLYAAGRAANSVKEFRQRIEGQGIIEFDSCKTSHTVMRPDGTYVYCEADETLPFWEFLEVTKKKQAEAVKNGSIEEESDPQSLIFISCLPWISYTSIIQPVPFPADSNPRITWGKYFEEGNRLLLPVTVLAHHALIDGKQIGEFFDKLALECNGF